MRHVGFNSALHLSVGYNLAQNITKQTTSMYVRQGPFWASNHLKGELLERSTLGFFNSGLIDSGGTNWSTLTPHRAGRGGIDCILLKMDKLGNPRNLMVVEAKFGASKLGVTKNGLQMSEPWIKPRLAKTATQYLQLADEIGSKGCSFGVIKSGDSLAIPLDDVTTVYVQKKHGRIIVEAPKGKQSALRLKKTIRKQGQYLGAASEGRVSFRARIIRLKVKNNSFVFGIDQLDSSGSTIKSTVFNGRLPSGVNRLLKRVILSTLSEKNIPPQAAEHIANEAIKNPAIISQIQKSPKVSWRLGVDQGMANAAIASAGIAVLMEVGTAIFTQQEIDLKRIARTGFASAGSASVGYYVSSQVNARLLTTELGRKITRLLPLRNVAGNTVAGLSGMITGAATSLAFAFIGYYTGMLNERQAKVMGISGIAGAVGSAVFVTGSLGMVTAFGSAGTGVAISSLSGAAANSAALAWLGGGAVSGGGGGMALGSTVLSGGATIVFFVAGAVVTTIYSQLSKREQRILVERRLEIIGSHLKNPMKISDEISWEF